MVRVYTALVLVILSLMMLIGGNVASAATPTPSPTLRPIQPSATSALQYLRPTPTMWNLSTPALNFAGLAVANDELASGADVAINLYNTINKDHLIDFVAGAIVAVCGLAILYSLFTYIVTSDN